MQEKQWKANLSQGPIPLTSRALHVRLTRGIPCGKMKFRENNASLKSPYEVWNVEVEVARASS